MKRSLRKILLTSIIMAFVALCLAIFVGAETYTITYYHGDTAKLKEPYSSDETVTLQTTKYTADKDMSGYTFYGWFSDDGVIYEPGAQITLTRDIKLYEAIGKVVNTEDELTSAISSTGWRVIKLGKDMSINKMLECYWSGCTVGILDMNGHNLTISNSQWGTGNQRTGIIIIGKGTINFTSNNVNEGAFYVTSTHGWGDGAQRLWVGKDVKINSNVPLVRTTNDMSWKVGYPLIRIWGDITCPYLVRSSQGLADVDVNIYDGAKINITSTQYPLLRDESKYDDMVIMSLLIHGGTFTFPNDFKGFVSNDDSLKNCFPVSIEGGTFNMDIAKYISVDYKTVVNSNGTYSVEPNVCPDSPNQRHKYLATDITVNCTEDGHIDYKCEYCNLSYTAQRFALGHNTITLKISDLVNTKKQTTPGKYSNTCTRCGSIEYTYFFPDPSKVYVDVKVKYERDGKKYTDTLRVKSSELFGFTHDEDSDLAVDTYLTTFGFTSLKYTFEDGREEKFKMSEVVGIEIPLGTTKIYGGYQHNTYTGVFYKNDHLQEVTLPLSLEIIQQGAFGDMPALTTVNGIGNVSDTIESYAFGKSASAAQNAHIFFDTLEINAKTVKSNAFKNCLATRIIIGENARDIEDAFRLDSDIAKIESSYDNGNGMLKEVFVKKLSAEYPFVGNENIYGNGNGRALSDIYNSLNPTERTRIFGSISTGSALLTKAPVYYDHSYTVTKYAPTCLEDGYTAYECKYCKIGDKTDFVSNEGITHVWERSKKDDVEATCAKEGSKAERCSICQSVQTLEIIPKDDSKHDFTTTLPEPDYDACTKTTYHLRRKCANGCGAWSKTAQKKITVSPNEILGHNYSADDEGIVKVPATCGTPGQTIKTCSRCYEQQITESPATGLHLWQKDESKRVAPTCIAPGSNFFNCKNCPLTSTEPIAQLTYDQAVEKKAHVWTEEIIDKPTRNKEGVKRIYCSLCNVARVGDAGQEYVKIPKLDSNAFPWWAILLIVIGGLLLVGGIAFVVITTVRKKKVASTSYKYKFNTFRR